MTALSMKIRKPNKSKTVASRFSDDSVIGKLLLRNFTLGQATFRIVWRVQSSLISPLLLAGPPKKGAQMMNGMT